MSVRLGDIVECNGQQGIVFEYKEEERDGCGDIDEFAKVTIRWLNGTISVHSESEFWSDLCIITPKRFVNIYLRDRAYGGGEEGGWWYDTLEPQDESKEFPTEEEAIKHLRAAEEEAIEENSNRRSNIGSVLSEGCYEVRLEAWPGEHYPKQRPRYC